MNREEKGLERWGDGLNAISVPNNLDDYVRAGIEKGKRSQKGHSQKRCFRTSIAVAAVLLLFSFCVRLSPTFAKSISHVPGLSYLVHLINGDPSLQQAVKNNYIQKLGLTETHGDTKITLDSMVADRNRIVIFYKMDSVGGHPINRKDTLFEPNLYGANGKGLPIGISMDVPQFNKNSKPSLQKIDIDLLDCKDSQLTDLLLKIKHHGQTWVFQLPYNVQKVKSLKTVYPVHQTVSLEGQRITFNSITVFPTGSAIDVSYDPSNTKQITHLDDLRLVDDQKKVYGTVKNGILAIGAAESNHQILYLDSNYFTKPKSLQLELSHARAIEKSELNVVINLKEKKILKAPSDGALKLDAIPEPKKGDKIRTVGFSLKLPKLDFNQTYQLFDSFTDGAGNKTEIRSWESPTGENVSQPGRIDMEIMEIPNKTYKEPLTFHLIDYPTRIYGKVDLKLK